MMTATTTTSSTPSKPVHLPPFTGAPMGSAAPVVVASTESTGPKKTSGKAVASLVCAIVGLFLLGIVLGPVAVCLALAAKNEIKERPEEVGGECMATSGMVIGIIGGILSLVIIFLFVSG